MSVKKRLGEILIEAGVIDQEQLQTALAHQRKWGCKIGQALVDLRMVDESEILAALSQKLGYQGVDVSAVQRTPQLDEALRLVPAEVARRSGLLPIASEGKTLVVAMSDPTNVAVIDEIAFRTGRPVKVVLATHRALDAAIRRVYAVGPRGQGAAIDIDESLDEAVLEPFRTGPRREPLRPPPSSAWAAPGPAAPAQRSGPRETPPQASGGAGQPDPAQLASALARLLVRKGLVSEAELLAELTGRPKS